MSYESVSDNIRLYGERFPNAEEVALEATFLMRGDPDDFKRIPLHTARRVAETLLSTLDVVGIDPKMVVVAGYDGLKTHDESAATQRGSISIYDDLSGTDLLFTSQQQRGLDHLNEQYRFTTVTPYHLLSDSGPIHTAGTSPGARIGVYDRDRLAKLAKVVPHDAPTQWWPLEVQARADKVASARVLRFTPRYTFGIRQPL